MSGPWRSPREAALLLLLSARMLAGRRFWIAVLLPPLWIAWSVIRLVAGWREGDFVQAEAQNLLIGLPLVVLAVGLGVRVIAGEIDRRTLEIAYTVPGGTHRVWLAKLGAAVVLLLVAEALLALGVWLFLTSFPPGALYGAFQAAIFYLVLSMGLAALFRSEAAGALVTVAALVLNSFIQGGNLRLSPFWNPLNLPEADPADLIAWTTQNRLGFVLVIATLAALAFGRAEDRERLMRG